MMVVNIAELKNRLSHYLRAVRTGEAIWVKDRDRVIARIEPARDPGFGGHGETPRVAELEAQGSMRRGKRRLDPSTLPPPAPTSGDAVGALLDERGSGR